MPADALASLPRRTLSSPVTASTRLPSLRPPVLRHDTVLAKAEDYTSRGDGHFQKRDRLGLGCNDGGRLGSGIQRAPWMAAG